MIRLNCLLISLLLGGLAAAPMAVAGQAPGALEETLAAEFALQSGRYAEAAERYARAAEAGEDPALAERATEVALMAHSLDVAGLALARWQALAPDAPEALAAAVVLGMRRGDAGAARAGIDALVAADPDTAWGIGVQALARAGASPALPALIEGLRADDAIPSDLPLWLALASLAQRHGAEAAAAGLIEDAVERFPDNPRTWLLQAGQLRERGQDGPAREAIARALAHAGDDLGLRMAAAGELDRLGDPAAAAAALASGAQSDPTWSARAGYLARAEDEAGLEALYSELAAVEGEPGSQRAMLLGQLSEYLGRNEEALRWYRGVTEGEPSQRARLRMAVVLERAGRADEAIGHLRDLQHDYDADGEQILDSYVLEADVHTRRADHPAAVAAFGRGLAIFEEDPRLLYGRALARERMDDIAGAEADLRLILATDPENVAALNALGYTLADRTDRFEEALGYIEAAFALDPDNPAIIDSLGWVLFRLGRAEEALVHLERAFEAYQDAEVAAHLGEVLWALGRQDEAREIWEQGRRLDPDSRHIRDTVERLLP